MRLPGRTLTPAPPYTSAEDAIDGRGGDDALYGYGGKDRVQGGPGNDVVQASRYDFVASDCEKVSRS